MLEEPEIHLHPTVMRRFAKELSTLVKEERKQLALTTHSEHFLVSLLNCVRDGLLQASDLHCYYVAREKKATIFSQQKVDSNGQIEGGVRSFLEAETEDLRTYLSVKS
jgi:predicted ATPase